jgi:hypothetical protein
MRNLKDRGKTMSLKDAIGKDLFVIDDDHLTDSDLQDMPTADLEKLKLRVNNKVSFLSIAIKEKQIDYTAGGEGATKEWYVKNKFALSVNQGALVYINSLIKQRRRSERNISDVFMDEAKAILPERDFEIILTSAQRKLRAG